MCNGVWISFIPIQELICYSIRMSFSQEMFNEYYDAKLHTKAHPELRFFDRIKLGGDGLKNLKHIHIIAVSGTAMGTFALMLRDSGFHVTGSDVSFWPPMGPLLKSKGVEIQEGWDPVHISDDVDLVIVGNACGPQHVEVMAAIEKKKPLMSMPELMGEYYVGEERESLVVAGTHGKTTTTGLLSHTLTALGKDPTYLIGGVVQTKMGKEGTSHQVGKGHYTVFEGDEYDTAYFDARPKFLHYRPAYAIITSAEWDHIDIYPDIETYGKAFEHLIEVTRKGLVVSDTYPLLNQLIAAAKAGQKTSAQILVYGLDEKADIRPVLGTVDASGQHFELFLQGKSLGQYVTPMYGEYNTLNTVAVLGILHQIGLDIESDEVKQAIASFPGMKRRQEIVKEISSGKFADGAVTIIDDFAHHPTAVSETLKGIRNRFPGRRIVALFEPRSNTSRRKLFEHTYPGALAQADIIGIKVPPYREEVDAGQDLLNPEIIKRETEALGKTVYLSETAEELVKITAQIIAPGDVVLVMSNGSFDGILDLFTAALHMRN